MYTGVVVAPLNRLTQKQANFHDNLGVRLILSLAIPSTPAYLLWLVTVHHLTVWTGTLWVFQDNNYDPIAIGMRNMAVTSTTLTEKSYHTYM